MRKSIFGQIGASAVALGLLALSAPATAQYLPSGVQTNVLYSTVTGGGWSLCYSDTYADTGASLSGIASGCTGTNMMLAARAAGSDTLLLLAQAPETDVMFDVGAGENSYHTANDVNWYFDESWSWGFADGGQEVDRYSCDINDLGTAGGETRLCWHTGAGALNGGWRAGNNYGLWTESYERLVFTFTPDAVPEPSTWAMMLLGFGGIGVAMRRRRKATAALA